MKGWDEGPRRRKGVPKEELLAAMKAFDEAARFNPPVQFMSVGHGCRIPIASTPMEAVVMKAIYGAVAMKAPKKRAKRKRT